MGDNFDKNKYNAQQDLENSREQIIESAKQFAATNQLYFQHENTAELLADFAMKEIAEFCGFEFEILDWEKTFAHFDYVRKQYQEVAGTPGVNTSFALEMCFRPLAERYERGERTVELYNEMMEVE